MVGAEDVMEVVPMINVMFYYLHLVRSTPAMQRSFVVVQTIIN